MCMNSKANRRSKHWNCITQFRRVVPELDRRYDDGLRANSFDLAWFLRRWAFQLRWWFRRDLEFVVNLVSWSGLRVSSLSFRLRRSFALSRTSSSSFFLLRRGSDAGVVLRRWAFSSDEVLEWLRCCFVCFKDENPSLFSLSSPSLSREFLWILLRSELDCWFVLDSVLVPLEIVAVLVVFLLNSVPSFAGFCGLWSVSMVNCGCNCFCHWWAWSFFCWFCFLI